LAFQYLDVGSGSFDLNYHVLPADRWITEQTRTITNHGGWLTVAVRPVAASTPFGEYAIFDRGVELNIRAASVSSDPVIVSLSPHDPGETYLFPQGSVSGRLLIPVRTAVRTTVTVTYLDSAGVFALNILDPVQSGTWQFGPTLKRRG